MSAVKKAVELIGGQTKTAKKLTNTNRELKQGHVYAWICTRKQAPAKYIRELSALTNNQVTIEDLLADHENTTKTGINA
jgi:DNA-binding transcriptional regulator YdaS (Cro superfamily)